MALMTLCIWGQDTDQSPEFRLLEKLMKNYKRSIRPVVNNSAVPVTFDIAVNQVLDLVRITFLLLIGISSKERTIS